MVDQMEKDKDFVDIVFNKIIKYNHINNKI